ncbi:MAG TPA: hypothetical protein VFI23_10245 [Rhizomicrobium sp.]|nr:hypothetical protein [Rhizomicrobium sp.]
MKDRISVKIINLARRQDRREACRKEMAAIGWGEDDYAFFTARDMPGAGARGCSLSHGKAIADFLFAEEKPFLLVLEDDFSICAVPEFLRSLETAIAQSGFWDVFLLGHTFAVPITRTPVQDTFRVINAQTTAAYLVGRLYASKLMETFFRSAEMLDRVRKIPSPAREMADTRYRCDILWKQLQDSDRFCAKLPALVVQRPCYSDVENKQVDYNTDP